MKTTEQIHALYEMNNHGERDISQDKWYSEEEINQKTKSLKNFIGNSRFEISNKSLKELYDKIKELFEN